MEDVLNMKVALQLDRATFLADVQKIARDAGKDIEKPFLNLTKMMGSTAARLGKDFTEAMRKGMDVRDVERWGKKIEDAIEKGNKSLKEGAVIQERINKLKEQGQTDAVKAEIEQHRTQLANINKQEELRSSAMHRRIQEELESESRVATRRIAYAKQYNEFMRKSFVDQADTFRDSMAKTFEHLKGGDLLGLNKSAFGTLRNVGSKMQQKGIDRRMEEGGSAGMGEKMGAAIAGISGAALAIGAVAGGMLLLVKTLIDADNQAKEMNKELLQSSGALDLVSGSTGDLTGALKANRDAIFSQTSALEAGAKAVMQLGLTSKEYQGVLQKFAETGITWSKMAEGAEDVGKAYANHVTRATTIARMFGLQLDAATESMANNMQELGQSVDSVAESFAVVGKYAQESGYGTKRFYNMVQQATSGMTMYNVRLEDTAALMMRLTRVLGMKGGAEFHAQMAKGLGDESYQDRTKRILTTGEGTTKRVLDKQATSGAAMLAESLKGLKGVPNELKGLSGPELKEALSQMSQGRADDLMFQLRGQGQQGTAAAERMDSVRKTARGATAKGGLNRRLSMEATGLSGLGTGGTMAMELNKMKGIGGMSLLNDEDFQKRGLELKMAMEAQGVSAPEQERRMKVVGDVRAGMRAAKGATGADAQRIAKSTGLMADAQGNLHQAVQGEDGKYSATGAAIDDMTDALYTWGESQDNNEKARKEMLTRQEELSKQVAENTYDLTNLVKDSVLGVLNKIAGYVSDVLVFLNLKEDTGLGANGTKARNSEIARKDTLIGGFQEDIQKGKDKIKAYKESLLKTDDPEEKKRIQADIDAEQKRISTSQGALSETQDEKDKLEKTTGFASSSHKAAFELMGGNASAMSKVSSMSEGQAKDYIDLQKKKGAAAEAAASPASAIESGQMATPGAEISVDPREQTEYQKAQDDYNKKYEKGNTKAQREDKKLLQANNTSLSDIFGVLKKSIESNKNMALLQSLQAAGIAIDPATAAALSGAGSAADRGKVLDGLNLSPDVRAAFNVEDAYIPAGLANTVSYSGPGGGANLSLAKGDAIAIVNENSGRGGGSGGAAVSINMTFNGPADAPQVRDATLSALKQFYGQISGTAATHSR